MNYRLALIFILLAGLALTPGASASDNKVPREGTVYVGEGDLDLSDCSVRNGDEIAWWESGNPQGTPSARARVDDVRKFTIDPDTFRGHSGDWYTLVGKKLVFRVEEPFLQLDIIENGIDRDPDLLKRGSLVSFKISTNLAGLSRRAGSSGPEVRINMTGPNETEYLTLSSTRTNDFNLEKVYAYTSPYDTGAVWDTTDEKKFPDGEYTFSASTRVNRIHEVFPESGISYTEPRTLTLGKTEERVEKEEDEEEEESEKEEKSSSGKETDDKDADGESESDGKSSEDTDKKSGADDTDTEKTGQESDNEEDTTGDDDEETATPTETPTPEPTPEETPEMTEVPTPEPTEEPTPVITPRPTRTPYPRPPGPGASPTQAAPLPPGIILTALVCGGLLVILQRRT